MTVSQTMRRYAAEIYRLQQDFARVPLSLLTGHMDLSTQSIALMIQRMKSAGYVEYEPYRGVTLTSAGERIAMPAIRRHRLVEVFLVKIMRYDWAAAHELADTFENGLNDEIEDRVDELSGFPRRCPHGEPIPDKAGQMPLLQDKNLVEVPSGSDCTVSRVRTHDADKLRYLADLGLLPGVPFHLLSCAPFRGPLRLLTPPTDHVISYEMATHLWVEVEKVGPGNK